MKWAEKMAETFFQLNCDSLLIKYRAQRKRVEFKERKKKDTLCMYMGVRF